MKPITTKSEKIGKFLTICSLDQSHKRKIKAIFYETVAVASFDIDSPNERKLAVIELVERGFCNNTIAGELCGFHRNTVGKILETKRILGVEAVLEDDRGLKTPYKYIDEVRSHITNLLNEHPQWKDEDIAEQAGKDLGMNISRSAVARIRTAGEKNDTIVALPSKKEILDLARLAESMEDEHRVQLKLWLDFNTEPELQQKAEEYCKEPALQAQGESQQAWLEELREGVSNEFAGSLMHHLFLGEIGFEQLMAVFPRKEAMRYQSGDILGTIFHSITRGIPSIEALKLVNANEFGLFIGRRRGPDKVTLRDHLCQIAQHERSEELIDQFARRLLEQDRIAREVFFIDGHFLPYYGLSVIAKGYFTVRRLAMKGNELYAITDLQGRPLFFITESNEIDFRPIIARSVGMLEDLGIKRPIMVFDRGGYGIHFFKELDQQADFVTWAKYLKEKTLADIPDEAFTVGAYCGRENHFLVGEQSVEVSESAQSANKDGRSVPSSMTLRLVVLKDVDTGKRLGIYTNNTAKSAYDIAYYMIQRWGKSENVYKELMAQFNLNYHPGYDVLELEQQPLVDNPEIALTKKAIGILKKEAQTAEKDIVFIEAKLARRNDKRLVEKKEKFQHDLEEKKEDIAKFEEALAALPDKVSIVDLLKGKPMCRCDLEKKRLYDMMQFMAYHSRERLVEEFRNCYDDHRDIKKVLDMITRKSGLVKLVGQTLMVMLEWIDNKKHREAAKKLCDRLNKKGITMVGGLAAKLSFHIARFP